MKKWIACLLAVICMMGTGSVMTFAYGEYPDWYPENLSTFQDFHDLEASRVVDDADVLTDSQEEELKGKIQMITDKTGFDFVIYTTNTSFQYGSDRDKMAADFYQFNGYGYDEEYSGSTLTICFEPGNRGWTSMACGSARKYFTEKTVNAIDDYIEPDMKDGNYYQAMLTYVEKLDTLYETGTLEYREDHTGSHLLIAAVIGLIAGLVTIGVLTSGMKQVRIASNATPYVVPGSERLRVNKDHFLYVTTRRVRREDNNKGGGSSYSGNVSSSGGRSFSGGGRSF